VSEASVEQRLEALDRALGVSFRDPELREASVTHRSFAFEHDLIVVVAAGNTPPGVIPNVDYPGHVEDPDWGLGSLGSGFNTLVVGSYVAEANADGVGRRPGWPSPFARD